MNTLDDVILPLTITHRDSNNKIKVLCLSIWYPLSMSRYFEKALRHRDDVDLITTGPFTSNWIAWLGGMTVSTKYALSPEIPLPFGPSIRQINYELVQAQLPDKWIPDVVLCIDAGISWKYKPSQGQVVHVATDPHVLNYDVPRKYSDKFFNMQKVYSKTGDIYLPYAYSKYDHYPEDIPNPADAVDAVLIGMPYEQRVQWINELRRRGVSVIFENGPIFEEARALYNRGRIGLNWSSLDDLNARAFELPAMKLYSVMNRVTDMNQFPTIFNSCGIFENNQQDAISHVLWAKENPESAKELADKAYEAVKNETYDSRIETILKECKFL